jgi:outer membrane protein assembly factor BamB
LKGALAVACIVVLCLSMFLVFTPKIAAEQSSAGWPMYRADPAHTGVGTGNPVLSPKPLWNYTTGLGVESSPAVVGNVVYIGSDDGRIYALNATTGVPLWSYLNDIDSSPAVVNGVVFIGSSDGNVYALDASNGAKLWNYTTAPSPLPSHVGSNACYSPAVVGGVVYVGSQDFKIYALNAANGEVLWSYATGGQIFSSPAVANGVVYIGSDDGNLYALNAGSGAYLWQCHTVGSIDSSPAIVSGVVYVGSDYAGTLTGNFLAVNASTGAKLWNLTAGSFASSSPAVADNVVYIGSTDGVVYALNATNGEEIWNQTVSVDLFSSPAVVDGVLYIGSSDDVVPISELPSWIQAEIQRSKPLPSGATLPLGMMSDVGGIHALNTTTGEGIWNYTTGGNILSSPTVVGGIVYFGSLDDKVYALGNAPQSSPVLPSISPSNEKTTGIFLLGVGVITLIIAAVAVLVIHKKGLKTTQANPKDSL